MRMSLKSFAENAYVNLASGLILLFTACYEIVATMGDGQIGVHHGVAVFAVLQILKTLPHFVHGAEQISRIQE